MRNMTKIEETLCFSCSNYENEYRTFGKKIVCIVCGIKDPYMPAPRKKQCMYFNAKECKL
jgi:hypothetical protein